MIFDQFFCQNLIILLKLAYFVYLPPFPSVKTLFIFKQIQDSD